MTHPLDERIAALSEQIRTTRLTLVDLHNEQHRLQCERVGIELGKTILASTSPRRAGKLYLASNMSFSYSNPWADGRVLRKGGTWSDNATALFSDWRIATPEEIAAAGAQVPT